MDPITITLPLDKEAPVVDPNLTWYESLYSQAVVLFEQYPMVGALLILMGIDIISGWIAAGVKGKLSSNESRSGVLRKALMLLVVAAGYVVQRVIPGVPWGQFLALGFVVTEIFSIVENCGKAGVPIPKQFMEAMEKLREREQEKIQPQVHVDIPIQVNAQEAHLQDANIQQMVTEKVDSKGRIVDPRTGLPMSDEDLKAWQKTRDRERRRSERSEQEP